MDAWTLAMPRPLAPAYQLDTGPLYKSSSGLTTGPTVKPRAALLPLVHVLRHTHRSA